MLRQIGSIGLVQLAVELAKELVKARSRHHIKTTLLRAGPTQLGRDCFILFSAIVCVD